MLHSESHLRAQQSYINHPHPRNPGSSILENVTMSIVQSANCSAILMKSSNKVILFFYKSFFLRGKLQKQAPCLSRSERTSPTDYCSTTTELLMLRYNSEKEWAHHLLKDKLSIFLIKKGDYFAVELVNGHVYLHLDLGSGSVKVKATSRRIDDGTWHEIAINRNGKSGRVTVDGASTDFITPGKSLKIYTL